MRTVAMYTADRSDQPTKCRHFAYNHFNNFGATKREAAAARRHRLPVCRGRPQKDSGVALESAMVTAGVPLSWPTAVAVQMHGGISSQELPRFHHRCA
jgi:hypothetical protein